MICDARFFPTRKGPTDVFSSVLNMLVPKAPWSAAAWLDAGFAQRRRNAVLGRAVVAPMFQGGVKPPHSKVLRA